MGNTREIINEALSQRGEAKIKVRQPLSVLTIQGLPKNVDSGYIEIIKDEVNVHNITYDGITALNTKINPELKREGLMREIVRHIQNARKKADLSIDDRISLSLVTTNDMIAQAISEHQQTIMNETLATRLIADKILKFQQTVNVEGHPLEIGLEKA